MRISKKGGFHWQNWDLKLGYKPVQWRSTVTAPTCAFCNKNVYPAEEVIGGGQRFHKLCLKCTSCNTLLNVGNLNEHEKQIYCGPCYRRQFGPQASVSAMKLKNRSEAYASAVSRSLQTISSMSIDSSISSPRLNQTEKNTSMGSSPSRSSSEDDFHDSIPSLQKRTYVSGVTLRRIHSRPSPMNSTVFKIIPLPSSICPRCAKTVYSAEEVKAAGKSFHRLCSTCAHCRGSISGGRYSVHNGEIYDNNCYRRLFGPSGTYFHSN